MSISFVKQAAAAALALPILAGLSLPPDAQETERRIIVNRDSDYFGGDYNILKEVTLDQCQAECTGDNRCKAFTFNTSAGWCFLKEEVGEFRSVAGAVSGRVIETAATDPARIDVRRAELDFLAEGLRDEAARYAAGIAEMQRNSGSADEWIAAGNQKRASGSHLGAIDDFRQAVRIEPNVFAHWARLTDALRHAQANDWRTQERLRREAVSAAINTYLHSAGVDERAAALDAVARALAAREQWKPAIRTWRASLSLRETQAVRAAYDDAVAKHGFRILEHRVDSDAAQPQICLVLSDDIRLDGFNPEEFVTLEGAPKVALEAQQREICIDGVRHGERYAVLVREGLPAADGEKLEKSVSLDIFVRDRQPSARFPGTAYILPGHDGATIPIVTVNTDKIEADLYRIVDRSLARTIGDGAFLNQLSEYDADEIVARSGEKVWTGEVEVGRQLNEEVVTAIAVEEIAPELKAGAYVLVARTAADTRPWEAKATQWFVVTDLGLTSFSGSDGFRVLARSLTTAEPLGDIALRLVAVNNSILGTATTDADGFARFDPGLVRGSEGNAPALVVAERGEDYAFLDLKRSELDLTDRGVEGRAAPGPVDVFLTTERGVYRPAQTVWVTALARDGTAEAITDLPLTMIVYRPDGKESERQLIGSQPAGGSVSRIELSSDAMRGSWRVGIYADPKGQSLAETSFLVEDFLPERLDFELAAESGTFGRDEPLTVALDARFLYGAPASGLSVYGRTTVEAVRKLDGYPGFVFGLAEEEAAPVSEPIDGGQTDDEGHLALELGLPASPAATQPLSATVVAQVEDTSGRPVERTLSLPVASDTARLGLKPLFEGSAAENSKVSFDAIAIDDAGERIAASGIVWTLSKVETDYQWYQSDGRWNYEVIHRKRRLRSGTLDVAGDAPAKIDVEVEWGGYELMLSPAGSGMAPVSHRFEAGWYVETKSLDSPEALKVALDKGEYRIGETAQVQVTPPFAGKAQIMVIDNRVIATRQLDIPEGGATIELPVTEEWGAGAYVTAIVYRPMDLGNKRMPARAVGLAWAAVDPQARRLAVDIEAGDVIRPRQTTTVRLKVDQGQAGEKAYVTLAAVDAGILNLTGFATPDPDGYYFGQRRLGVEIRDFYNQLIDRMQGAPGRVRSGGDGSAMRFDGPPPPDELMAFHSDVREVAADGTVEIEVPLPDFNGTVRLMAMAWTVSGVGHAERDVVVRDPVVVTASMPRFLAPGDRSRVLIDITDVEGVGGEAGLAVESSGAAVLIEPKDGGTTVQFGDGGRRDFRVPVEAIGVGQDTIKVSLSLADGTMLVKSLPVAVRDNEPPVTRTSYVSLAPRQSLRLSPDLAGGLRPGTGAVTLSASGAGRLDLVGIVRSLDRFPYGCAEQLTSRALPLLYLDEVVLAAGLGDDDEVRERVQKAIVAVLANQSSSGGFGLWGPGSSDLWLDAYVTDFLSRARERGFAVPDEAFRIALDNLKNRLAYAPDFDDAGQDIAYATYVLARHGQAALSDIRYWSGARLDSFATPLAKAQLAAALALYGDETGADRVFRAAVANLTDSDRGRPSRNDYGSRLRDNAAILTLASETGTRAVDASLLADDLDRAWRRQRSHSTQEEAWTLLAAHALTSGREKPNLALNGQASQGPLYRRFELTALAEGVDLENRGSQPVSVAVTARGTPLEPEPAGGNFASITRGYFTLEGEPVDLAAIGQGERFVAVLTIVFNDDQGGQIIIDDPLPAGFEIDNPSLLQSGEVGALDWLSLESNTAHQEFRADRFIASLDRSASSQPRVELAYVVRAVSPGRFAHPAAIVEDMYRPERNARTGSGAVEVVGPLR